MKKFTLLGIILISTLIITQSDTCKKHPIVVVGYKGSLNHQDLSQSSTLVSNFLDDNTTMDLKTNIWLDKAWVNNTYKILNDEANSDIQADGFRIYFGKKNSGKNSIVIVSTKAGGGDANAESKNDHIDYFEHANTFFGSSDALELDDYGDNPDLTGATLYGTPDCSKDKCNPNAVGYLKCSDAFIDVSNFANQKSKTINTQSEWFPLKELKGLSDELDSAVKKGIPADGIRIYYGKIANDPVNGKHKNRHNFIIITTNTVNGIHKDYYSCYNPNYIPKDKGGSDNGEQCLNNCNGIGLPTP